MMGAPAPYPKVFQFGHNYVISRNKTLVSSVSKTTPLKAKPNTTKTPSDGDVFHAVSISVVGGLSVLLSIVAREKGVWIKNMKLL